MKITELTTSVLVCQKAMVNLMGKLVSILLAITRPIMNVERSYTSVTQ